MTSSDARSGRRSWCASADSNWRKQPQDPGQPGAPYVMVLETRHGRSSRHRWQRNDRRKSNEPGDAVISRSARRISIRANGGEPPGRVAARQSMQTALRGYSLWSSRPTSARTTLSTTSFTAPFPIAPLGPFSRCPNRPKMSTLSERGHQGSVNEHRTCQSKLSREVRESVTSTRAGTGLASPKDRPSRASRETRRTPTHQESLQ